MDISGSYRLVQALNLALNGIVECIMRATIKSSAIKCFIPRLVTFSLPNNNEPAYGSYIQTRLQNFYRATPAGWLIDY